MNWVQSQEDWNIRVRKGARRAREEIDRASTWVQVPSSVNENERVNAVAEIPLFVEVAVRIRTLI
jgi:hypothetical protein